MRILLDMDGPLADFDDHFWSTAQALHLAGTKHMDSSKQTRRFATDLLGKCEAAVMRHLINTTHWFADLPVTSGAQAGVQRMFDAGHDVWVVTKPLEVNPFCLSDKAVWLAKYFPSLVERLITAPNKSMVVGDVLIDDAPRVEWFEAAAWEPWIYETAYNGAGSKWDGLPRFSWDNTELLSY